MLVDDGAVVRFKNQVLDSDEIKPTLDVDKYVENYHLNGMWGCYLLFVTIWLLSV
jgi:DNA recombination-dependent growth factor C